MMCHVCGGGLESTLADMPFNLASNRILILKDLPVLQCGQCGEYYLEDPTMKRVDEILEQTPASSELEVLRYAT